MSDIGGLPLLKGQGGNEGSVYGIQGPAIVAFALDDEILDIFDALTAKIEAENLLAKLKSKDSFLIEGQNSKSILFAVGEQPFLLIRQNEKHAHSFVFDPVAKTFFGRTCDVFPALFHKVERETKLITDAESRLNPSVGLVEQYAEADCIGIIMKATEARRQAAAEFLGLVEGAERLDVCVLGARQQLNQICALIAPREKAAPAQPEQASTGLGGFRVWLQRALGA